MNVKEMAAIFDVLKAAYPYYFKQIDDPKLTLNLWASMFETETPLEVASAVRTFINTDRTGYMPSIGIIKDIIAKSQMMGDLTEDEAWDRIRQAASNGLYNADTEFAKLPDTLKAVVVSPEQLKDWASMDSETFNSVVASNFRRSYRVQLDRKKELLMIPPSVQRALNFLNKPNEETL